MAKQNQEKTFTSKKWDPKAIKWMLSYVLKNPWIILFTLSFMLLADITSALTPYLFKLGIDSALVEKEYSILVKYSILMTLSLSSSFVFSFFFSYQIQKIGQKMILLIRMDILEKIFSLNQRYFDSNPIGKTLTHLTSDVEAIKEFISDGIIGLLGGIFNILIIGIILFYLNPWLALATTISLPLFLIASWFFKRSLQKGYRGVRKANSIMNTILIESITGIKEITLFNHKEKSLKDFDKSNKNYLNSFLKIVHSYSLYFPLIEVVSSISMIFVLFSVHLLFGVSDLTVGDVFAFFFYINMFFRPLRHLAEQFNTFQLAMSASERLHHFLTTKDNLEKITPPSNKKIDLTGDIAFKDVAFNYSKDKPVFTKLNFKIKKGQVVALVGSTGSGKSTIISLLNGLYPISKGSITINNHNLKKIPLTTLRDNIATIPQDVFLFTGSFIENISLGKSFNKEDIYKTSRKIRLDSFINKFPKKYEENVLEEGKSLSTGQKQLLAFARSFIQDSPIIVLDEATANIDSESEKLIELALKEVIKNKTAIIIAHRLSTIQYADKILVLKDGKIVEQGNHETLLKKKKNYYKFYQMQSLQLNKK